MFLYRVAYDVLAARARHLDNKNFNSRSMVFKSKRKASIPSVPPRKVSARLTRRRRREMACGSGIFSENSPFSKRSKNFTIEQTSLSHNALPSGGLKRVTHLIKATPSDYFCNLKNNFKNKSNVRDTFNQPCQITDSCQVFKMPPA